MAALFANMVRRGTKKFSEVPESQREAVRVILVNQGLEDLTKN